MRLRSNQEIPLVVTEFLPRVMGAMAVEVVTLPVPLRLAMVAGAVMEALVAL
jgi:hypothetical protein